MYTNYALEEKTQPDALGNGGGLPTGIFWMNEATTRAAAGEVLETHKGLKGA